MDDSEAQYVRRLESCLREIYRTFDYGPGADTPLAPHIKAMIDKALNRDAARPAASIAAHSLGAASFGSGGNASGSVGTTAPGRAGGSGGGSDSK